MKIKIDNAWKRKKKLDTTNIFGILLLPKFALRTFCIPWTYSLELKWLNMNFRLEKEVEKDFPV